MALWRSTGFAEDAWTEIPDDGAVPADGAIVVSIARWTNEREALTQRAAPVGVAIAPGKDAETQLGLVEDRPLVQLTFPKFADGRAYSLASLLRDRHGFKGELRASGDVLLDELPFMVRCGFTSFQIVNEPTLRALRRGHLPGVSLFYQPAVGPHESAGGERPWLRRRAS